MPETRTQQFRQRYDRSIRLFTEAGQQELHDTHVAVVGTGGIGSQLATQLGRLGIGTFTLIDPDVVERSNLSRLAGGTPHDVGQPKVTVLQHAIWSATPSCDITTIQRPVDECLDRLDPVDIVVAGVDTMTARTVLNEYAVTSNTPYLDAGTRIDVDGNRVETSEGYVQYINPGTTGCFECLGRTDPAQLQIEELEQEELEAEVRRGYLDRLDLDPQPAVIYLNGVIASLTVSLLCKHVLNRTPLPGLLRYSEHPPRLDTMFTSPSSECPVCGSQQFTERDLAL